jgi:hypothetical protein
MVELYDLLLQLILCQTHIREHLCSPRVLLPAGLRVLCSLPCAHVSHCIVLMYNLGLVCLCAFLPGVPLCLACLHACPFILLCCVDGTGVPSCRCTWMRFSDKRHRALLCALLMRSCTVGPCGVYQYTRGWVHIRPNLLCECCVLWS